MKRKIIFAVFLIAYAAGAMDDHIIAQINKLDEEIHAQEGVLDDLLAQREQARALPNFSNQAYWYEILRSNYILRIQSLKDRRLSFIEQIQGHEGPR